jgi:ketosteroid isomerase-like protein
MPAQELALAQAAVRAWAAAWEARNLDTYLAAYGKDFVPADNVPRKKWEQVRRQRVGGADGIEVKILDLTVEPAGRDMVKAVFIQKYQARGLSDLSRKTLVLKKQDKSWKIQSEQATPLKG